MNDATAARNMWPDMPGDNAAPARPSVVARAAPPAPPKPSDEPARFAAPDASAVWPDMKTKEDAPPQPRKVARASGAVKFEERLFPDMPGDQPGGETESTAVAEASDNKDASAERDQTEEAPTEIIEIAPGYHLKAPEGFEEYNTEALDTFAPLVERYNIENGDAQRLLDIHAQAIHQAAASVNEYNAAGFEATKREWRAASRSDPELTRGGLDKNLGAAKTILKQFGSPELKKTLTEWGMTDNPEFIKFLVRTHGALHNARMKRWGY